MTVPVDAPDTVFSLYPYFQDAENTDTQLTFTVTNNTNLSLFTSVSITDPTNFTLDYAPGATGVADITIRATDTDGLYIEDTFRVTTDVNETPILTVPGVLQQSDANGAVIFNATNGNLISVADDAGSAPIRVTLTATHGTMTLHGVAGLTFDPGQGDGTADAIMSFSGTVTDINNALNGMSFNHDAGYYGMAHVTVAVDDQGNTGSGGPQTANGAVDLSVEPYDTWFAGFETEAGWDVFNSTAGACSYYTHDYTVYWQQMNAGGAWNFYNGTAWVSTDALGNAPYDGGYGPPNEWFHATTGAYSGYDVYIRTTGATTYFSLDHTATGATYWQLTNAGAWSYYDGSAWYPTAAFEVEPTDVWFHGYDGIEAGWDTLQLYCQRLFVLYP